VSLRFDAVVIGAGAAGLFCAAIAGQRGLKVLLIDHYPKVAEKIRISGGGRCNFTNRDVTPANFLSENPHFCKSALARYGAKDFIALVQRHRIAFHEKHKGQLFCDESAEQIIAMLLRECELGHVTRWQPCSVQAVRQVASGFELDTQQGMAQAAQVIIASGGLPIPRIGASDFGLRIAKQFNVAIIPTRPALVPLTFDTQAWAPFSALSGLAQTVAISCAAEKSDTAPTSFLEDLLFTHRGLSGPAVLQISSFWREGTALEINLAPTLAKAALVQLKAQSRKTLPNALAELLPERLAHSFTSALGYEAQQRIAEVSNKNIEQLQHALTHWQLIPNGSEGYKKAEVMAGGVSTDELSSSSMEAKKVKGLYFIGEVVDVTGWLGGYNFQWAWSSAYVCAQALTASH
jgi:predicted Rossmann fold flavoprotein